MPAWCGCWTIRPRLPRSSSRPSPMTIGKSDSTGAQNPACPTCSRSCPPLRMSRFPRSRHRSPERATATSRPRSRTLWSRHSSPCALAHSRFLKIRRNSTASRPQRGARARDRAAETRAGLRPRWTPASPMKPVALRTARLVLDQPTLADADLVTEYCRDPVFKDFMVTPWPYHRGDAEVFLGTLVPQWWESESEYTWALRLDGILIGVIGYRTGGKDIGFWLGAPHRGKGYMAEAVAVVLDWIFEHTDDDVLWECVIGNASSVAV